MINISEYLGYGDNQCTGTNDLLHTSNEEWQDGRVLLLIHGAGGDHLVWPKEIQRLPGTAVYNLDLPGHGRSAGAGRSSVDDYADVVQEFMELLALQDVTIVGHSMGGAIALGPGAA